MRWSLSLTVSPGFERLHNNALAPQDTPHGLFAEAIWSWQIGLESFTQNC